MRAKDQEPCVSPAAQLKHPAPDTDVPGGQLDKHAAPANEYVSAQHRHASVNRHEPPLPLAVLDQLGSAVTVQEALQTRAPGALVEPQSALM